MKKRLLTLLVAVTVALSLFSGFSVMASGDGYVEFYTTDGVSIDEMTTETAVSATVNFTTAKKTAAKPKKTTSTATKRTTAAKKSGKKVSAPKAPVAPAPSVLTAPVAKDAAGVEEKSYVNLGGTPLPVHLL